MSVTGDQVKAARTLLGWSQTDLAATAGLSEPTVKRFERDATRVSAKAVAKMVAALEAAGIAFSGRHAQRGR